MPEYCADGNIAGRRGERRRAPAQRMRAATPQSAGKYNLMILMNKLTYIKFVSRRILTTPLRVAGS